MEGVRRFLGSLLMLREGLGVVAARSKERVSWMAGKRLVPIEHTHTHKTFLASVFREGKGAKWDWVGLDWT